MPFRLDLLSYALSDRCRITRELGNDRMASTSVPDFARAPLPGLSKILVSATST